MSENGFCNCLMQSMDSTTESGKLFMVMSHHPDCVEYPAALEAAVKMANDYPRLQQCFDDAMSMLWKANNQLKILRSGAEGSIEAINQTLADTDE